MGCHPILLATHESVPSCSTRSIGWAARSSAGAAVTRSGSTSRWKTVPSLLTMRGGLPLARRSAATARPAHQVPPSRMQASGSSAVDAPSARRTNTASSSTDSFVQAPRRKHQSPRPLRFADLRSVRNRLVFQADSEAPPSIGRNKQSCDTPPPRTRRSALERWQGTRDRFRRGARCGVLVREGAGHRSGVPRRDLRDFQRGR